VDAAGNALLIGETTSSDFPTPSGFDRSFNGAGDAFVAKVTSAGQLAWASYLGGNDYDEGTGIAVDSAGNALLTGYTWSSDFPTPSGFDPSFNGDYDPFVAKVTPAGQLVWASYLGGSRDDYGSGIAVDSAGNALLTGYTWSSDFPMASGLNLGDNDYYYDAFVAKIGTALTSDIAATNLQWDTVQGGVDFAYQVTGANLTKDTTFTLYWSPTETFDPNTAKKAYESAVGKPIGNYGPYSVSNNTLGVPPDGTKYLLLVVDPWNTSQPNGVIIESNEGNNVKALALPQPDIIATDIQWDTLQGGVDFSYQVTDADLIQNTTTALYWSPTATFDPNTATKVYETTVQHAVNNYGPFNVSASALGTRPDGSKYLLLVVDPWSTSLPNGVVIESNETNNVKSIAIPPAIPPFEVLARGVAYKTTWMAPQEVYFDFNGKQHVDLHYKVQRVFAHADGFYALGLISDEYGPALVIRGTEDILDIWSDSDPNGIGYDQFIDNWKNGANVYEWLSKTNEPVDIIGHSLGGAIAQWIAAAFTSGGGLIDQLVTFNSPGISKAAAGSFVAGNAKVTHYIVNGDVVSMAGWAYIYGTVQMASFIDLTMWDFDKHLLPLLTTSIGSRLQPSGLSWQSITTEKLSSKIFSYTALDYNLYLLGTEVALKRLAPPLAEVPAILKFRGTTEVSRQLIGEGLRKVKDLFNWQENNNGNYTLKFKDFAINLPLISVTPNFSLTVDSGSPPMLRFEGGLSIDAGTPIDINLPSWLGGHYHSDCLMHMVGMDLHGVIDREHLAVYGQLDMLGGLLALNGNTELDWSKNEWAMGGQIAIGNGFVSASGTIHVGSRQDIVIEGKGDVTIPNFVQWVDGTHIADGNFMLKFVNDGNMSNDFVAGWGSFAGVELGLRVWFNGKWDILGARPVDALGQQVAIQKTSDEQVGKLDADPPRADGSSYQESYAIAPETGWALFDAEWENASTTAALTLKTPSGQVLTEADIAADPSMTMVAELGNSHRKVVRVNTPAAGTWVVSITDTTGLGVTNIAALVEDVIPSVNVTGLSGGAARQPVEVDISAYDPDSESRIALFYDTDNQGFDGVLFADGLLETDGTIHYTWDTSDVAAGEYYVYAMILDDNNPPVFDYSSSTVKIDHLIANRIWDGGGADSLWTTAANWVGDAAPLPGDTLVFPSGAMRLESINDFPAGTQFASISVLGTGYLFHNGISSTTSVQVPYGTLSVDSIVADTLTIGAPSVPTTRIWSGGGSDNGWSTPANWIDYVAPLPGDYLLFPPSTAKLESVNDYPAGMIFGSIEVLGSNYIFQNGITSSGTIKVSSGTLTTSSIVCDTLVIGQLETVASVTTANAVSNLPKQTAGVHPRVMSDQLPSPIVANAENTPAMTTCSTLTNPPRIGRKIEFAYYPPPSMLVATAEAPPVIHTIQPSIPQTASASEIGPTTSPLLQSEHQDNQVDLIEPLPNALLASDLFANFNWTTNSSYQISFSSPSQLNKRLLHSFHRDSTDFSVEGKKPSITSSTIRNAHSLALQSLISDYQRTLTIEPEEADWLVGMLSSKHEQLAKKAVESIRADLAEAFD
jgi:hypothetical protein